MNQPKFKVGDKVQLRNLPHSQFETQNFGWNPSMNKYIGKKLTIVDIQQRTNERRHLNNRAENVWMYWVKENTWAYEEYVLTSSSSGIENDQLVWI